MKESTIKLSKKDIEFREFSLNGNMWSVILYVSAPLAVYQLINHVFNILDTLMAAQISSTAVSTVAYLSQLQMIIAAIGAGFATGSSIKISQAYGAGDYELVKKRLSSVVVICLFLAILVLLLIPFTPILLKIAGTPEAFINKGAKYFNITLIATTMSFFNNIYISIERARGNSKRIMYLNTSVIILKLFLTAIFVYKLNADITMIAFASVISQFLLLVVAVMILSKKNNVFGFSYKYISLKKSVIRPIINLSIPVTIQRAGFFMGKVIVNSMAKKYGNLTVGALGISNNINGLTTNAQIGFQDGGVSIISQNIGAKKIDRALKAFKVLLVINILIGFISWVFFNLFIDQISYIFANSLVGFDGEFQQIIKNVYVYDSFGSCVPLGVNTAVTALLFAFDYSKLTLVINFIRIFAFRIPVLWALQRFTTLGSESVGIVMAISNISVMFLSLIAAYYVIKKIKRSYTVIEKITA
ncbi:MAG: MATE family efflux transporter [Clostridiales bacterium]